MTSYTPQCRPKKRFLQTLVENYNNWREFGLHPQKIDPRTESNPTIDTLYEGGTRRGVKQKAHARVIVCEDGALIYGIGTTDTLLAKTDLQNLTGIKLRRDSP